MCRVLGLAEDLYHQKLAEYVTLSKKEGTAYGFYACATVLMPNCVTALVLFYGGKLVIDGEISSGKLVSFLLYLSSLSDAFNSMGSVFSALTQALGAADKGKKGGRECVYVRGQREGEQSPADMLLGATDHKACRK